MAKRSEASVCKKSHFWCGPDGLGSNLRPGVNLGEGHTLYSHENYSTSITKQRDLQQDQRGVDNITLGYQTLGTSSLPIIEAELHLPNIVG